MYEHHRGDECGEVPTTSDRVGPQWAEQDRELDPGDVHDKGEVSLCVGEAA